MRVIDTTHMEVVSMGIPWRHALSPCSKQAIALLERNTKVVTWLMPRGGRAQDQIPCILYKERYYSLSLRMQKAIYRHIRLKKGFKNEELVNGQPKLRIPDLLLKEKIRTQSRFDVRSRPSRCDRSIKINGVGMHVRQAMRNGESSSSSTTTTTSSKKKKADPQQQQRDRSKSVSTVAWRMKEVLHRMVEGVRTRAPHPQLTIFLYRNQQCEITNAFFQELEKENVTLFGQRDDFMAYMMARYDEFMRRSSSCTTATAMPDPKT
jgi:hypothetical protein